MSDDGKNGAPPPEPTTGEPITTDPVRFVAIGHKMMQDAALAGVWDEDADLRKLFEFNAHLGISRLQNQMEMVISALSEVAPIFAEAIGRIEAAQERTFDVIQRIQRGKKKEVTLAVRTKHTDFCRALQRTCMACEGMPSQLFEGDRFIGEIHHAVNVSDASLKATMAICPECNKRINSEPLPIAVFQHYQIRLHRWLENAGPLFDRSIDA